MKLTCDVFIIIIRSFNYIFLSSILMQSNKYKRIQDVGMLPGENPTLGENPVKILPLVDSR